MGCLIFLGVVVAIWLIVSFTQGTVAEFDRLVASGLPARGILLKVSATATRAGSAGVRRFERRAVLLDVELPGQAPYEVSLSPLIPTNLSRDVLPGATVELRVDRSDRSKIAIVGPGVALAAAGFLPPADQQILSTQLAPPRKS